MNIVKASYDILEPKLQKMHLPQRIEYCGRICYKSEDKITDTSAESFCNMVFGNGHGSVLEMARIHLIVYCENSTIISNAQIFDKYIQITTGEFPFEYVVSGSPRAFNEGECSLTKITCCYLNQFYPIIFKCDENYKKTELDIRFAEQDEIPYEHKYVAVKLITNRAVTHEIVRHRPCTFLQESQRYCRYSNDKFGNEVTFIKPIFFNEETVDYDIWYKSCQLAEMNYFRLLDKGNSPQAARTVLPNSCKTEITIYASTLEWEHIFSLRVPKSAEPSMREITIPLQHDMIDNGYIKKFTQPYPFE